MTDQPQARICPIAAQPVSSAWDFQHLARLFARLKLFLLVEGHITSSLDALSRRLGMAVCAADMRALSAQGIRFALLGEQWHVWMAEVAR